MSTDEEQGQQLGSDGDGNRDGEVVAVVELCLRQPDGWLPFNGFLQVRATYAENTKYNRCEGRVHEGASHKIDVDVNGSVLGALLPCWRVGAQSMPAPVVCARTFGAY